MYKLYFFTVLYFYTFLYIFNKGKIVNTIYFYILGADILHIFISIMYVNISY